MEFTGKAVIEISIECESEEVAKKKFDRAIRVVNYGVRFNPKIEPTFTTDDSLSESPTGADTL